MTVTMTELRDFWRLPAGQNWLPAGLKQASTQASDCSEQAPLEAADPARSRGKTQPRQPAKTPGTLIHRHPLPTAPAKAAEASPDRRYASHRTPFVPLCSHRSSRLRHRHLNSRSARSQPAERPMCSVNSWSSSTRSWKEERSESSHSYGPISSPRIGFCTARLTHVNRAFKQPTEQRTV